MERWEDAERLFREVVEINRRQVGLEHPRTLNAISNLAAFHLGMEHYDEAEELFESGLDPMRRIMGDEHPMTLKMESNLAWLYILQGRYPAAESLLLQNLEVKRRVLGELHPSTVGGLENLVALYERMGAQKRLEEAEALSVETLRRVCDGPTARARDRLTYANLLLTARAAELRDPGRALSLALQAVDETDRKDAAALAVLARAYEQTGDRSQAVATAEEALELAAEDSEILSQLEEIVGSPVGGSS
jgi:tetratricopeptide (TPR) repeat protein